MVSPLPTPKKHRMISGGADLHRCRATPFEVLEHPLVAQTAAEKNHRLGKPWWVTMRIWAMGHGKASRFLVKTGDLLPPNNPNLFIHLRTS